MLTIDFSSAKYNRQVQRKERRKEEGKKEERVDCEKEKKGGEREWRLRIIGASTGNRRSRYSMLLLRAVSVSGDTKTNVFMR